MKLQIGDILAVHGDGIISRLIKIITHSPYSHIAVYIGDNQVIESDAIWGHIRYKDANEYKNQADIYRCEELTNEQKQKIREYLIKQLGYRYDYLLILILLLRYVFKIFIKYEDTRSDICSELANDAYFKAGIKLSRKKYPSPKDIANSSKLVKIGEF